MKLVVAVGGASGSIYAKRLLDVLAAASAVGLRPAERATGGHGDPLRVPELEVGLVFSSSGAEVWKHELGDVPPYPFKRYGLRDFHAPFASGSAGWDAMIVIPCSTGGLARIAHGISDNLIGRAADVMMKERRKLVLVVRETPLSTIHLENMLTVTRAGAVVLPAAPSFYTSPTTIEALLDTVVGRALDQLGLPNQLQPRWGAGGAT
ncbi:MAG TPA: UbiX family flavin prenyltransferase [Polyangia bacterium]|nr:UbiX family flavin prenyltransferase [Polyangia bacterium]